MDLQQALAKIKELETAIETEKTGRAADLSNFTKEKETLTTAIATKDAVITQKTDDIVKLRQSNTRIKDLSEAEKKDLTDKQLQDYEEKKSLQDRYDALEKQIVADKAANLEIRRNQILDKFVDKNKNPEARAKLEEKLKGFVDFDKIEDPALIEAKVNEGFTLVKVDIPTLNPVSQAHIAEGGAAPVEGEKNFADTEDGKGLAAALNLSFVKDNAGGAN